MAKFRCTYARCGETVEGIGDRAWCSCTFRRYVKGEGMQSFHVEMERIDTDTRSAKAYELVDA